MFFVAPATGWREGKFSVLNDGLGGKPYGCGIFPTREEAQIEADRLNISHNEDVENQPLPADMQRFLETI